MRIRINGIDKPHLYRSGGVWVCEYHGRAVFGGTPAQAFSRIGAPVCWELNDISKIRDYGEVILMEQARKSLDGLDNWAERESQKSKATARSRVFGDYLKTL